MKYGKRGIPTCSQCFKPAFTELFQMTYREESGAAVSEELTFCSRICFEEYFEDLWLPKVDKAVRKELKKYQDKICPACSRRIRGLD